MAGIMDLLNQGLGGLNTPVGQLGIQMLMNSGAQQGNPGFGQRMGQAVGGMQQMQAQQQQMEMQKLLRDQQAQEIMLRQMAMGNQVQQREALKQAVQSDPNFLANNPTARAIIGATGDTGFAADLQKLQPMQKPPTMPGVFERRNQDNTVNQMIYNPQTGGYDTGPAYTPTEQQRAEAYVQKTQQDMQYKPQEVQTAQERAQAGSDRVKAMVTESTRKSNKAALDSRVKLAELDSGYRGATTQMNDAITLVDDLLKDEGLGRNFGVSGWLPNAPSTDAANARAKLERLKSVAGLSEMVRLGNMGIRLTPWSDKDFAAVTSGAINLDRLQDVDSAKKELTRYRDTLVRAKDEAAQNYNALIGAYQPPSQQQQTPAGTPAVGTVMDGYRYNGGNPADPNSWSKQ